MPHLRPTHAGTRDTLRILSHQLKDALEAGEHRRARDERIHEARKALKKCRATLRLLRAGISARRYRRLNGQLREAGRPLSAVRDARVLLDTLRGLGEVRDHSGLREQQLLHAALRTEHAHALEQLSQGGRGRTQLEGHLESARRQVAQLAIPRAGWSVLGVSLCRVYEQGRSALHGAQRSPDQAHLHEWRKQVKYLRYQIRVLEPLRPKRMQRWEQRLHELSDALGDDHDLSVLRDRLISDSRHVAQRPGTAALLAAINARRQNLQQRALALGGRLYRKTPAQLKKRLHADWRRWKGAR